MRVGGSELGLHRYRVRFRVTVCVYVEAVCGGGEGGTIDTVGSGTEAALAAT